jgi:hypothetical protein
MTGSTLTYAYSKKHCQSIPTLTDGNKFSMRVLLSCLPNIQINDCVSMETGKTYWKYVYVPSASSTAVSSSALRSSSSSSAPLSVSSDSVQLPSTVNDQQLSEETAIQSDLLLHPSSSAPVSTTSTASSVEGKASALVVFPPDVAKRIIKVVRSFGGKGRLVSFLPKDYYRMYGENLIYAKGTFHQLLSAIPGLRLREVFKNDSYALFVDWKPTLNTQQVSTVVDPISSSSTLLSPSSSSSSSFPHIAVQSSNRNPDAEIDVTTDRLISNAMINTKQDLASAGEAVRSSSSEQKNDISVKETVALTSSSSSTTNKQSSSSPLTSSTHPSITSPTVVSMNSCETATQLSSSLSSDKLFSLVRERLIEIVKASGKEGIDKSEIFKKYYEMFQEKLHLSFPYLPKNKNNLNSLLSSLSTVSVSHNIMSPSKCRCFYIGSLSTPSSLTVPAFTSNDSTGTSFSTSAVTPSSSRGSSNSNRPPDGKQTTEITGLDVPGYYSLSFSSSSELHPLSSSATKIYVNGSHPKINGRSGHISKEVLRKKGIKPFPHGVEVSHLGSAISPDVSSSSWLTKKISEIFQKG